MADLVRGTCVAFEGRGLLIVGKSGSGKSTLALQLMAMGCELVSDDQTLVDDDLRASAPPTIRGLIEARGMGVLRATATEAEIVAQVDLDNTEAERVPPARSASLRGREIDLFYKVEGEHFPFALIQYLKCGMQGD